MKALGAAAVFLLLWSLFAVSAGQAREVSIALGNGSIAFDPGASLCALDRSASEYDRMMLDWQEQTKSSNSVVLGVFVACRALDLGRAGRGSNDLSVYGVLTSPLQDGEIGRVYGQSRAEFLVEAARFLDSDLPGADAEMTDRINRAQDAFVGPEADDIAIPRVQQLGLLAADESAAYAGLMFEIEQADYAAKAVGVLGVTIVNGYVLNYQLYDAYIDETTLPKLLADVQAVMRQTAALNPASGFGMPPLAERDDLGPFIRVLVAGAVFSVLAGLVRAVRRRRRA